MFLACPAFSNETWKMTDPFSMIMDPKWNFVVMFWFYLIFQNTYENDRFLTDVYENLNEIFNWWFVNNLKKSSTSVSWSVLSLGGKDGADQLVIICENFEKIFNECSRKFWKDFQWMFHNLFFHWMKKTKQVNWWLNVEILKKLSMNVSWSVSPLNRKGEAG